MDELFDVQWQPFQLNERAPMEGTDKMAYYVSKFGAERVKKMIPYMVSRRAE